MDENPVEEEIAEADQSYEPNVECFEEVTVIQFPGIGNGALEKTGIQALNSKYFNRKAARGPLKEVVQSRGVRLREVYIPWHKVENGYPQIPGLAIPFNVAAYYRDTEYKKRVMKMVARVVDPFLRRPKPGLICFQTHSFGATVLTDYLKEARDSGKLKTFQGYGGKFDVMMLSPALDKMVFGTVDSSQAFFKDRLGMAFSREETTQIFKLARRVLGLSIQGDPLSGNWMPEGEHIDHQIIPPLVARFRDLLIHLGSLNNSHHWGVFTDKKIIQKVSDWFAEGLQLD